MIRFISVIFVLAGAAGVVIVSVPIARWLWRTGSISLETKAIESKLKLDAVRQNHAQSLRFIEQQQAMQLEDLRAHHDRVEADQDRLFVERRDTLDG